MMNRNSRAAIYRLIASSRARLFLLAALCADGRQHEAAARADLVRPGATAGDSRAAQDQRQRPPESLACPRNRLTAYIGKVLSLSRREDRTVIRIRTDWDTAESVMLKHPGTDDPSKWFLMRGQPFRPEDSPTIEVSRNKLKPDVRATAWVCDDGSNPIVDWQTPSESRR